MIKAVIDIGTNTAHLLIARVSNGKLNQIIRKNRQYTYLGEGGLAIIQDKALTKLYEALYIFHEEIAQYQAEELRIIATDALRSASNGPEIQEEIEKLLGKRPTIISGLVEAKLIASGVQQGFEVEIPNYLIMDIGGGSVEFILITSGKIKYITSVPLGISRLYEFGQSDQFDEELINILKTHIKATIPDLIEACNSLAEPLTLIGSAGTFEVFLSDSDLLDLTLAQVEVDLSEIALKYKEVMFSSIEQRSSLPWLPKARMKYIVVALLLMHTIVELLQPAQLIVSKYALKEGALTTDLLNEL